MQTMYLTAEKLDDYAARIGQAEPSTSEKICTKIVDEFEGALMDVEGLPPKPFEFIKRLLSDPALFRQPGVWKFLMVLSAGRHRLEARHFDELGTVFRANFRSYDDETLCLAVCDFVARNYPRRDAKRLLVFLEGLEREKDESLRGLASEGLWVLEQESNRAHEED